MHLVNTAFSIEQKGNVHMAIDSALEVFPVGTEPTEDIEGYAMRRFLLALRAAL